jgi:Trypsin-like serine proteases, typically periplasmic, contain C-terminal PDZ domain
MSQNTENQRPISSAPTLTTCSNCHSAMPSELRFCRNCGFRLGEGVAEYTETVRFDGSHPAVAAAGLPVPVKRKRRRLSGMAWVFVALLVFFVGAAAFTALVSPINHNIRNVGFIAPTKVKSYVGVSGFDTVDDGRGVTFDSVDAPDGPADKAGLVGGDVITSFDGHAIHDEDQISELMISTPIGKTVDVEYLRDGQQKTTKLTTVSEEEFKRLKTLFDKRPEGRGQFGYDDGDAKRVKVPGMNIYGVQLGNILQSRPADLAGIKEGDIVIQFGDTPIRTEDEFRMRVRRALPYSTVNITVMRGEAAKDGDEDAPKENAKLEKIEIPVKMGKQ